MRARNPASAGATYCRFLLALVLTALVTALGCDLDRPVQKSTPPQPKSLFKEIPMGDGNAKPR
jgi:hypothetical protein